MPDSYFTITREGKPSKRRNIRINGTDATFWLQTDPIENGFAKPLTPDLLDLLEIASAVFLADTSARRGGEARSHLGSDWYRQIDFHLEVRNPELWSSPAIKDSLVEAIEFLTGDRVTFEFAGKPAEPVREPYLPLAKTSEPFLAEEVILFSGGLDSFAGALEALKTRTENVILVTHRSAPKAITRQRDVGKFLKSKFGKRVLHLHVKATRARSVSSESTQRARSFLFASLAYAVARMADARRISFYENGVVSHNLPISPQVIGTMASRTTHPLALRKLQAFFDHLDAPGIEIRNEFEWLTKTDILRKIDEYDGATAISTTVSCTTLRNETSDMHHCGACSQCLDRRFAILAAGLEAYDRAEDYKIDVIAGERDAPRSRTMAFEWTRHACTLAKSDIVHFRQRFISDLVRIVQAYPGEEPARVLDRVFQMQHRHGAAVIQVIGAMIGKYAHMMAWDQLPDTSLLKMYLGANVDMVPPVADPLALGDLRISADPEPDGPDHRPTLFPLRVAFFEINEVPAIEVEGLGCVRYGPAAVAHDLKPQFDADVAEGLAPENHHYVPVKALSASRRHVTGNTVTQMIKRCRNELAELYAAIEQRRPEKDLLIETKRPKGYRLDPTLRVIRRDQLRNSAK